jgi:integrase
MTKIKAYIFKPRRRVNGKVKTGEFYHLKFQLLGETRYRDISLGVRERAVAEEKRREFIRQHESEAAGIIEPKALRDSAQKQMKDHLTDFLADLEARGKDEKYVYNMGIRVGMLLRECGWEFPKHVTPDSFLNWRVTHRDKAAKTLNDFLASASAVLNWMERQGRVKANPLRVVGKVEGRGKERRVRRALSPEQMRRLVAVSDLWSLAYLLAAHTGLRRAELEALQWGDVLLDAARPFLRVRASTTKNRRQATIFLHQDLIGSLRGKQPVGVNLSDRVLERCPTMKEMKADLTAAGIPYEDERGRIADFHALRYTLATNLANSGVARRVAMEMMRHSDSRLTDKTYTDASQLSTAAAVDALPSFLDTHTVKDTQLSDAACPSGSCGVSAGESDEVELTSVNKGESHELVTCGTSGHVGEMVRRVGIEPTT